MDRPATLSELYFDAIDRYADRPALRFKPGTAWQSLGHREVAARVRALSCSLGDLGLAPGDRVAILSENRPEWAIADFASLTARLVNVPIYPTLTAPQVRDLLRDSGSRAVFVSSEAQAAKVASVRTELPDLTWIVSFDPAQSGNGVIPLESFLRPRDGGDAPWRARALESRPDDVATIIYTSGTTGEPKGVMLTHGNIASNIAAARSVLGVGPEDECLSLLPLSHIFERMTGHYCMFAAGVTISYAPSLETVPENLREIRPTVVAAVPRLYEKVYGRALETANHGSPLVRRLFHWARETGERWADRKLARAGIPLGLSLARAVADRLVFARFRARLGGRLRFFISGGAPLSAEIAKFFYAAGIPILEGYGLTETSPVITVNTPDAIKLGTVGRPIPGVSVKIAEDGEILTKGPHVMAGYFNKPEETRQVIDPEGWFHTGDIGEIDEEGFLRITDRKKDLIATAGGKKIAPQPIENLLRKNPFIANAVMLGDRRKFAIALLVPDFARLESWAKASGLEWGSREELVQLAQVKAHLEAEAKKHFRDLARFEVPKRFLIVPRDFSIEGGELTPKLSVRRRVVEDHYRAEIDALYREGEE